MSVIRKILISVFLVSLFGCGPATKHEVRPATNQELENIEQTDVKTQSPASNIFKELDAVSNKPTKKEPTEQIAEEPPHSLAKEPIEESRFVMKGDTLEGPFQSMTEACRWIKANGFGQCINKKNDWDKGKILGERGGFLGAKTQLVQLSSKSPNTTKMACGIMLKTTKGW